MTLDDLLPKFPELPSAEEIQKHMDSTAGELYPVTVCECGERNFMHRLGCRCGGQVKWLFMDRSGSVIECGVDFSPWPRVGRHSYQY